MSDAAYMIAGPARTWTAKEHAVYEVGYVEGESNREADYNLIIGETCEYGGPFDPASVAAYIKRLETASDPIPSDHPSIDWWRQKMDQNYAEIAARQERYTREEG